MALNDNAVLSPAKGYVFTGPVGTAAPAASEIDSFDPAVGFTTTGWNNIGHTSNDDLPEFGFDGGDTEVRGSWQNHALREVVTQAISDYLTVSALQFDNTTLGLYYGTTNASTKTGTFAVSEATKKTIEKALLLVIVDGDVNVAFHAPHVSVRRDDSIAMSNDGFAAMPLRFTMISDTDQPYLMAWISSDTITGS